MRKVIYMAVCGLEFQSFSKEIEAIRWAAGRPGSRVELVWV